MRSDSKNEILIEDFYFILPSPRLLQKGSRLGLSNERSSNHGPIVIISEFVARVWDFYNVLIKKFTYMCCS